jgi:hypothetical protein
VDGGQERHRGEARHDRAGQPGVKLALADRPGHQVEQPRAGRQRRQQVRVGVGRPLHQEVGQRAGRDVPPVRAQRERREQQRREAERLVGRHRRVHDGRDPHGQPSGRPAARGRARRPPGLDRDGPADRPRCPAAFLGGPVGEQRRVELTGRAGDLPPAGHAARGDGRPPAVVDGGEQPGRPVDVDLDVRESREREQQRRAGLGEQPGDKPGGGVIAQRQFDRRRELAGRRDGRLRERQPQDRHVAGTCLDLARQRRDGTDNLPGPVPGPPDRPGRRPDARGVADRDDRREPDAEPPDRLAARAVPALARRPQRGQRLNPGGVQRRAGVQGGEHPVPQR